MGTFIYLGFGNNRELVAVSLVTTSNIFLMFVTEGLNSYLVNELEGYT